MLFSVFAVQCTKYFPQFFSTILASQEFPRVCDSVPRIQAHIKSCSLRRANERRKKQRKQKNEKTELVGAEKIMSMDQCSTWSETLSTDLRKVVDVLLFGQKLASELQIHLRKPPGGGGLVSADDLVTKISQTYSDALSILSSSETRDSSTCQSPMITQVGSPSSDDRKSEDSGEKRRTPDLKDRRGGNKRRKASQVWTEHSATPIDDGYAWRKYGQKEILHAKYPRSYFRCTHKHDQGCQATKQVQRTEDDPPIYRTIYMGHHTCKDTLKPPQLILDSYPEDSSCFLNFQSAINTTTTTNHKQQSYSPFFTSLLSSSIKSECPQDIQSGVDDLTHINNQSSSEYLLSPDLKSFESSGPTTILGTSTSAGSDHGDVISSVYSSTSSQSLDMDFLAGQVDFDDVFHFDEEIP